MAIVGTLIGGAIGGFGKKPKVPDLPKIDPTAVQQETVLGNLSNLPGLKDLGGQINRFNTSQFREAFESFLPGFLSQASDVVRQQLSGEIPDDVSAAVQRSSAAQAFGAGFGGGSGLGRNLTLRDLGLTSLGIQQQGLGNFQNLAALNRAPLFDVSSMFFTPQQRLAFSLEDRGQRFERDLLANQIKAAPSPFKKALTQAIIEDEGAIMELIGNVAGIAGGFAGG